MTVAGAAATNESRVAAAAKRVGVGLLVVASLWGLWEGYKWLWETTGWTWPFAVDDGTMPHLYDVFAALLAADHDGRAAADPRAFARDLVHRQGGARGLPARRRDRLRARRAPLAVAAARARAPALHRRLADGTDPRRRADGRRRPWLERVEGWQAVAILAAYLTFFPVAINTLRGLHSVDPRAVELMHSYAASRWRVLWQLRVPASVPYIFTALKISATASVIGAIIGETPASIQNGLGGAIVNFNQYYSLEPTFLWATNVVCAALGIVVLPRGRSDRAHRPARRAGEHRMSEVAEPSSRSTASRSRSAPA